MKKKFQMITALLLALLLTACGTTPASAPATEPLPVVEPSDSAETTPMVAPAEITVPSEEEHEYMVGCKEDGMLYAICLECDDEEVYTEYWTPLTKCRPIKDSNPEGSPDKKDVLVGDWKIIPGTDVVCKNAMKFWVVDQEGYSDTEWVEYGVDENYDYMSGMIALGADSESGAKIQVNIYVDEVLAYSTEKLSGDQEQSFLLEIPGAKTVRIECVGHSYAFAHGVVNCAVF